MVASQDVNAVDWWELMVDIGKMVHVRSCGIQKRVEGTYARARTRNGASVGIDL